MAYQFEKLPQLIDMREGLAENGEYYDYGVGSKKIRAWHHSLTRKHAGGSDAAGFADYHVHTLGWPGIGYHFVIEPKNVVNGRARIVWCHDPGKRSYHVGDSNTKSLGICVAGDYRYDSLDDPTRKSIAELHDALEADGVGEVDKAHNQLPGYLWKPCCVFDYDKAIHFLDGKSPESLPGTYTIQEGDTFWSIAKGLNEVSVDDLIAANPNVDPTKLNVGQKISLGEAKGASNQQSGRYVHLPASASSWRIYPTSVAPTKGNEKGYLNPAKFGGLTYKILGEPQANVVTIKSGDFGKGNIYVASSTGATFSGSSKSNASSSYSGTDKTVHLPASARTWRTYKLNVQPIKKNSDWSLTPARYGGLTYKILDEPYPNVVTIKAGRGKRNIYVGPGTGAVIR